MIQIINSPLQTLDKYLKEKLNKNITKTMFVRLRIAGVQDFVHHPVLKD
jgi:hypothetical protein